MTLTVFLMTRRGQGLRRLTLSWWLLGCREEKQDMVGMDVEDRLGGFREVWTWAHGEVLLWDGTVEEEQPVTRRRRYSVVVLCLFVFNFFPWQMEGGHLTWDQASIIIQPPASPPAKIKLKAFILFLTVPVYLLPIIVIDNMFRINS